MRIDILGVGFQLERPLNAGCARWIDSFIAAYDHRGAAMPVDCIFTVSLRRDSKTNEFLSEGERIGVHASISQPEWNFGGTRWCTDGVTTCTWPTRHATIRLDHDCRRLTVTIAPHIGDSHVAETLFHTCRGVALYARDWRRGPLVHASAIAGAAGAVAFCGAPGAGKTTLLLHAVLNLGYWPVANDRMLLWGGDPLVVSFPGYVSCCEGSLLADDRLARAAIAFERGGNDLRTMSRPMTLRNDFSKKHKRLYPMSWLVDLTGKPYTTGMPLAAFVLPRLGMELATPRIRRLDLRDCENREAVKRVVRDNLFIDGDTAFLPWHGLRWPGDPSDVDRLLTVLSDAEVPIFEFRTSPMGCPGLSDILYETAERANA